MSLQDVPKNEVARPLRVLTPLIKQDFEDAERAGMTFYKKAGDKLIEAREGHFDGDTSGFFKWAQKTFGKKPTQIRTYMALAAADADKPFKSLRKLTGHEAPTGPGSRIYREWTGPVDAVADRARDEQRRIAAQEALTRQQERQAEATLGLRLIDIGYKVLARELHPDKGGSRDAMARLNRVRDRLKQNV